MSRPVLLLDIDGVVNVIQRSVDHRPPYHVWSPDQWNRYTAVVFESHPNEQRWPILVSQMVVDFLTALSADVDIRWHTFWQQEALRFGKLVGLPEFPVQDCPEWDENHGRVKARQMMNHRPGWWKYMAAERVVTEEKRPLIWLDDDLFEEVVLVYRNRLKAMGQPVLLVCPDLYAGLTRGQVHKVLKFVEEVSISGALSGS